MAEESGIRTYVRVSPNTLSATRPVSSAQAGTQSLNLVARAIERESVVGSRRTAEQQVFVARPEMMIEYGALLGGVPIWNTTRFSNSLNLASVAG